MKNLQLILLLLIFLTSCNKDSNIDIDADIALQKPIEVLFSSELMAKNYPDLNKVKVSQSLESSKVDGEIIYAVDLVSSTNGERKLYFKIEDKTINKAIIIEHYKIAGTKNIQFRYSNNHDTVLAEYKLEQTSTGFKVNNVDYAGYCYWECIKSYTQQCLDAGYITTVGCVISGNFIAAACLLHCL